MQSTGKAKPKLRLFHVQTTTLLEIPQQLSRIRIGKPNTNWLPDIDLSNFPNSDIVSRSHLEIRLEDNNYYIEDLGSANGTYLNGSLLRPFTPCQLRVGDKIDLGKDERFTLLFKEARQPSTAFSSSSTRNNRQASTSKNSVSNIPVFTHRETNTGNQREQNQGESNQEESFGFSHFKSLLANLFAKVTSIFSSLTSILGNWVSQLIRKLISRAIKAGIFLIVLFLIGLLIALLLKSVQTASTSTTVARSVNKPFVEIPVKLPDIKLPGKQLKEPRRIRVPYTNENRPPEQPSCDCPYDRARDYSICGARSAYVRPGGKEPACYIGETTARERWYRDDNPNTHFVDKERKGR
ncbi:FHA domain-containing protein [Microcoleus sp. FACHB-SPT15]|uniref:FHA domain-containing protein n=1 Tax=Microcoleus sp. FACHB-SPT15 TaxID=2692830 RepID=UPI001782D6F2|nr:FHA domain-containing protein [Microcoleus sp. FACHB-SPT15]MBD1804061.1 FHA domain-containing protein [Microcoleus sp. FACHB-SPT15]